MALCEQLGEQISKKYVNRVQEEFRETGPQGV